MYVPTGLEVFGSMAGEFGLPGALTKIGSADREASCSSDWPSEFPNWTCRGRSLADIGGISI